VSDRISHLVALKIKYFFLYMSYRQLILYKREGERRYLRAVKDIEATQL